MAQPEPSRMDQVQRRIWAAKMLGGYDSWPKLAQAITALGSEYKHGYGAVTLRTITEDNRAQRAGHLRAIARVCQLPAEFFTTADFSELRTPAVADQPTELPQAILQQLEAMEMRLRALEAAAKAPPVPGRARKAPARNTERQ